jgi:hypothetical protein
MVCGVIRWEPAWVNTVVCVCGAVCICSHTSTQVCACPRWSVNQVPCPSPPCFLPVPWAATCCTHTPQATTPPPPNTAAAAAHHPAWTPPPQLLSPRRPPTPVADTHAAGAGCFCGPPAGRAGAAGLGCPPFCALCCSACLVSSPPAGRDAPLPARARQPARQPLCCGAHGHTHSRAGQRRCDGCCDQRLLLPRLVAQQGGRRLHLLGRRLPAVHASL